MTRTFARWCTLKTGNIELSALPFLRAFQVGCQHSEAARIIIDKTKGSIAAITKPTAKVERLMAVIEYDAALISGAYIALIRLWSRGQQFAIANVILFQISFSCFVRVGVFALQGVALTLGLINLRSVRCPPFTLILSFLGLLLSIQSVIANLRGGWLFSIPLFSIGVLLRPVAFCFTCKFSHWFLLHRAMVRSGVGVSSTGAVPFLAKEA